MKTLILISIMMVMGCSDFILESRPEENEVFVDKVELKSKN